MYYTNDWMDVNANFTVGKSMINGLVPYRDIFDHKGPVLFFVHCIAAIISYRSFLGVYLLEISACYAFLKVIEKSISLSTNHQPNLISIAVSAIVVYSSFSFQKGGSVEELSLPLLAYCLYVILRFLKEKRMPGKIPSFTLGVCVSLVFWMKFNLLGMFFGLVPYALVIAYRNKLMPICGKMILWALFGFSFISIIVLMYFHINDSISDLIEGYFVTNICHYHQGPTIQNMLYYYFTNTKNFVVRNLMYAILLILGVKGFRLVDRDCRGALILSLIFLYAFLFFSVAYHYYSLAFAVFIPWGACELQIMINKYRYSCVMTMSIVLLGIACMVSNRNILSIFFNQDSYLRTLNETVSNRGEGSILNYHTMDWGLNTLAGTVPGVKYFFRPNTANASIIESEQDQYLKDGAEEYILSTKSITDNYQYELLNVVDVTSLKGLVMKKMHLPVGEAEVTTLFLYGKSKM